MSFYSVRSVGEKSVLVFDTECRPMHYSEYRAESQITGIAWSWLHEDEDVFPRCITLKQDLSNELEMHTRFLEELEEADVLVGHYIRKHDLPLLSDHALRHGHKFPDKVMTHDTMDIVKVKDLGKSQENLAITFNLSHEKVKMSGADWRIANALTDEGRKGTRLRVTSDVAQSKELYLRLRKDGLLRAPKVWTR